MNDFFHSVVFPLLYYKGSYHISCATVQMQWGLNTFIWIKLQTDLEGRLDLATLVTVTHAATEVKDVALLKKITSIQILLKME